jgi:hypothetical protein
MEFVMTLARSTVDHCRKLLTDHLLRCESGVTGDLIAIDRP